MGYSLDWLAIGERNGLIASEHPAPPLDCSEADFQVAVVRLAKSRGWQMFHCFDARRSREGWPDWCFWKERFFMAELKTERGRVSKEQQATIDSLRSAGVCVYLFRPSDWPRIVEVFQ